MDIYICTYIYLYKHMHIWTCFSLSVRKLKNQPSNKLLLALFLFKLLRKEIFVNESHINLLFLSLDPVPRDSILCL